MKQPKVKWLAYALDTLGFKSWQTQEIYLFSSTIVQIASGAHPGYY